MMEVLNILFDLSGEIKEMKTLLQHLKKSHFGKFQETWINSQDVLFALKISKRTLQNLRDKKLIPFSRIKGKFYYKLSDIEAMLENNYSINTKKNSYD